MRRPALITLCLACMMWVPAVAFVPLHVPSTEPLSHSVQSPPGQAQIASYSGLHAAVWAGNLKEVTDLVAAGAKLEGRDGHGRTPLMLAAYRKNHAIAQALIKAGADLNARENSAYDLLTISSVLNDIKMVKLAIAAGADTKLITSPYDGTALIASAHLGHVEVVKALIAGGAPLDHVNNLNWTALIEAIVLGDGGKNHVETLRALVAAGADVNLADGNGVRPLALAMRRGYTEMSDILKAAGAKP